MKPCLEYLMRYFASVDQETTRDGVYHHLTSIGQPFAPSNLCLAADGLFQLDCLGLLNHAGVFCDVGSADGRVVALSAACLGIPSLGIEYDHYLVTVSKRSIRRLRTAGVIRGGVPASIIEGDFCGPEAYVTVPFGTIATFYCFESNCYCVAERIVNESPTGTLFVYFTQSDHARFRGLERLKKIDLPSTSPRPYFMYAFSKSTSAQTHSRGENPQRMVQDS